MSNPDANPASVTVFGMELRLRPELTQERLKEVLHYDPETGLFRWKVNHKNAKLGELAGSTCRDEGKYQYYTRIFVDGRHYRAHHLAWLWAYGRFPKEIDHIDRDGSNNRLSNLIEVVGLKGKAAQHHNVEIQQNNTTGHTGVYLTNSSIRRWSAQIVYLRNREYLGSFHTFEEAVAARQAAEIRLLGCLASELSDVRNRRPRTWRRM